MTATTTTAQDFRFESDVFVENEREPVLQHLTLFTGNLVYDFALGSADEVTMFDAQKGRVVLMNLATKTQTEVSTDTILAFTTKIKQIALANRNGPVALTFRVETDDSEEAVTVTSDHVTYTAIGMPAEQLGADDRYREFADWYARLNAMRPGNLPPFGRLELNRELANRQWLPKEITRTLVIDKLLRKRQEVSSKHIVAWQLTNTDRRRIQDVAGYQAVFRKVPFDEYLKPETVAAR
jgi:hypothetical protein